MTTKRNTGTVRTNRISSGHYEFFYKGHRIELIDLRLHGSNDGWIAPCDGNNDQEPRSTKRAAMLAAMHNVDVRSD